MALKTFTFPFGEGTQSVDLPEECILDVLEGKATPAVDPHEAARAVMRHPVGSAPLREKVAKGDKVCLVVSDITRVWNHCADFMADIVDELNAAGIPDEDISAVFAQGSHRQHTPEEDVLVLGEETARRIRHYQHDCHADDLVLLGTTTLGTPVRINRRVAEADKVILVGGITAHLFAGYGGGRKLVLPGVAGYETIQKNHVHALAKEIGGGVNTETASLKIDANPVSDDMIEACRMLAPCFLIHSINNGDGDLCRVIGGDWYEAWKAGTEECLEIQRVPLKGRADVTFASAGGYPSDLNLYQGCKLYDPADRATKDGGIIIAMVEARNIKDPAVFMDSFRFDSKEEMEKALRAAFTIPFFIAYYLCLTAMKDTVILVTLPENFEAIRRTGQIPVATIEEGWALAQKKLREAGKTDYTINILPHASKVLPILDR